jgi:Sigma-70 factor, region 1.2
MADEREELAAPNAVQELVEQLVARSEARGDSCVELSELSELIQDADLGDEGAEIVHDMLQERGLGLRDDCGRRGVEQTAYLNDDLAERTTDAMSLFLQEVRRYPLLTRAEEVELAKRIERGDLEAKGRLVNSNVRLVIAGQPRADDPDPGPPRAARAPDRAREPRARRAAARGLSYGPAGVARPARPGVSSRGPSPIPISSSTRASAAA